ncbi:hypothetical protein F5Y10DRAFT_288390 [Nemania abortiva]|nr:hypothetical protein F5Y10DRAFT_288390 [Nemania abortiva]
MGTRISGYRGADAAIPRFREPATADDSSTHLITPQPTKLESSTADLSPNRGSEGKPKKPPIPLSIDMVLFKGVTSADSGSSEAHEKPVSPIPEASVASYPAAPRTPDEQEEGICPICKQVLPVDELSGVKRM